MSIKTEFKEAITEYTGGNYTPAVDREEWSGFLKRLAECEYSVDEFIQYVIHHYNKGRHKNWKISNPERLKMKYLLISDALWDDFIEFKEHRNEDIRQTVNIERQAFLSHMEFLEGIENYTLDTVQVLLDDPCVSMNAVLRIDFALKYKFEEGMDESKVFDKYMDLAKYMVKGTPEYLKYCRLFRDWLTLGG